MKHASWFIFACLILALASGCSGRYPNATRTLLGITGYGVTLELLSSSASAPPSGVESEVHVGKWASSAKRGSDQLTGRIAPPGVPGVDWLAVTGGAGVILVTRVEPLPAGTTGMLFNAIDMTTQIPANTWSGTLVGLVPGRQYRVSASWFNGVVQMSGRSASILVNAG